MSCNLRIKITNGKKLVDDFYANLNIRDMVRNDNEIFGWTNDDEYVGDEDDKYYTQMTTTVDNVLTTCEKYKGIYLNSIEQLNNLKISRLAAKTKAAYTGLSEDIYEGCKEVKETLDDWTSLLIFYNTIIVLADKHEIVDYSALKIHMYLG